MFKILSTYVSKKIIHIFDLDFSIRFESIRNAHKTRSSLIMTHSSWTSLFSVGQTVLVVLLWILVTPNSLHRSRFFGLLYKKSEGMS
jgi:hypothetical protein